MFSGLGERALSYDFVLPLTCLLQRVKYAEGVAQIHSFTNTRSLSLDSQAYTRVEGEANIPMFARFLKLQLIHLLVGKAQTGGGGGSGFQDSPQGGNILRAYLFLEGQTSLFLPYYVQVSFVFTFTPSF